VDGIGWLYIYTFRFTSNHLLYLTEADVLQGAWRDMLKASTGSHGDDVRIRAAGSGTIAMAERSFTAIGIIGGQIQGLRGFSVNFSYSYGGLCFPLETLLSNAIIRLKSEDMGRLDLNKGI
jgi:hypothetical protein